MAKKKQKPIEPEEPVVEEFMEIGGAPVPGIKLSQVLRGHTSTIERIAWSPDGRYLASPFKDKTIRIWNMESKEPVVVLENGGSSLVRCVSWSPDGRYFAAGADKGELLVYDAHTWKMIQSLKVDGDSKLIATLLWSKDSRMLISGGDNDKVTLWNPKTGKIIKIFAGHTDDVKSVVLSPDGGFIASGSWDNTIRIWDINTGKCIHVMTGHTKWVNSISWLPDSTLLASGSGDRTIRIWDTQSGQTKRIIEQHTNWLLAVSFDMSGQLLASLGGDNTIMLWRTDTWELAAVISEKISGGWVPNLIFHPSMRKLASLAENDTAIHIWDIDYDALIGTIHLTESVHYITAKLVLVGDSGVGKTGLGWRLSHNEFKEHSSTHGQQFWVVPELKKTREDGTECEAVLWDLAGQHIYRSIHSIFLNDVDASLVLFDPTNRQEPLKGAQFWLEQLKGKKQLPPSVLVGARLDRGAPVLSQQELEHFCQKYGISGGYIGTSAKSGEGLDILIETLKDQIPWEQMTTTVTTVTFKRIKEFVLSLKEKPDRKDVLVRPDELRNQLQATDKDWEFTDAEMMTAVGHLENHGYVTILKSSSGEEFILLVPELLASVAASIFLHADKHPRELGAINETELLHGKYTIDEFKGLEKEEQQVLLDATVIRFLEHSICFRETLGNDNLLIFPSLIKQKRPLKDDIPSTDDISYIVRGRVENIYAVLVVLLGYTPSFTRINQWQNQAQYENEDGEICGFRLVEDREGEIELILYYGNNMSEDERIDFQSLFEQFLYQREVEVTPFPPVACPNGHRLERATVIKRLREGKKSVFCDECGAKTDLPDLEAQPTFGLEVSDWLKREEATARLRGVYETHLVRIKGYRRGWAMPRCYISCATEQKEFAERLAHDLADAGVFVIEEASEAESNDNIIIVDSKAYKEAWENNTLEVDIRLIKPRFADGKRKGLISITQSGLVVDHNIKQCQPASFCDPTHYVINLFDLVLNLYAIPLNHAGFIPLRQSLHQQWEQTLAQKMKWEKVSDNTTPASNKEVFVSYAWGGESEKLVNELDHAFQQRGVTIVRDKRDLGFKGSIKGFMETIGKGKAVVLVISEKYLKSENCMFELLQVAKHGDFAARIFPVVMRDANIYKAKDRVVYLQYWQQQIEELEAAIKSGSVANLQGIQDDLNLYTEIRANIAKLTDVLKDMNTLTPEIHEKSGFSVIFDAVMAKLEE
jgi:small GTP-binding protein